MVKKLNLNGDFRNVDNQITDFRANKSNNSRLIRSSGLNLLALGALMFGAYLIHNNTEKISTGYTSSVDNVSELVSSAVYGLSEVIVDNFTIPNYLPTTENLFGNSDNLEKNLTIQSPSTIVSDVDNLDTKLVNTNSIITPMTVPSNSYSICKEGLHKFENGVLTGPLVKNNSLESTLDALFEQSYGKNAGCTLTFKGLDNIYNLVGKMSADNLIDSTTRNTYFYDIDKMNSRLSL
jgi:hypothetical protein